MNASMVDLRYRTKEILQALARGEQVNLLHRGTLKGHIVPATRSGTFQVSRHPLFGMYAGEKKPVWKVVHDLRRGRYRAL